MVSAAIDSIRGRARGASTITQQLVRQRLLRPRSSRRPGRLPERKIKELIQSIRVTEAFKGDAGKQQIMAAYLNQNFYGNNSYGVKTAARTYFGVKDLSKLTIAQAAILAGLPQAPGSYDLVRNAEETDVGDPRCPDPTQTCLIVPDDSAIVQRRNYILRLLADDPSRLHQSGSTYTRQDFLDAIDEPVVLASQVTRPTRAPHFVLLVRDELTKALCGGRPPAPRSSRVASGSSRRSTGRSSRSPRSGSRSLPWHRTRRTRRPTPRRAVSSTSPGWRGSRTTRSGTAP